MKDFYTYIVTYDIKGDEKSEIRNRLRESLKSEYNATMLSESTYAFSNTDGVPSVKSKVMQLYNEAYSADTASNAEDKVWLICAAKNADSNTVKPLEMVCYDMLNKHKQ